MIWLSGSVLVSINEVTVHQAQLVLGWVTVFGVQLAVSENLSQYITSHPSQLSLAIPPCVGAVSTSHKTAMLCAWGVTAGMVRVWESLSTFTAPLSHPCSMFWGFSITPAQTTYKFS